MKINYEQKTATVSDTIIKEGDSITIDGSSGSVFLGEIPTIEPKITQDFKTILDWAQKTKKIGIRANADTPDAASYNFV